MPNAAIENFTSLDRGLGAVCAVSAFPRGWQALAQPHEMIFLLLKSQGITANQGEQQESGGPFPPTI